MQGAAHGGTYTINLDKELFDRLESQGSRKKKPETRTDIVSNFYHNLRNLYKFFL